MAKRARYTRDQLDDDILKIINPPALGPDLLTPFRQRIGVQTPKAPGLKPIVPTFPRLPKV